MDMRVAPHSATLFYYIRGLFQMVGESKLDPRKLSELEERLNYLEYTVNGVKKVVTPFKGGPLKDQTEDFLKLMEVFQDAITIYRDEITDQVDLE
jgi:hypothetical protein